MREASRAERTLRDAEWRPDRASAEAARGCIRFRQEPDTRTGVSSLDTPAMHESYSIRGDLTTPQSILPPGIVAAPPIGPGASLRLDRIAQGDVAGLRHLGPDAERQRLARRQMAAAVVEGVERVE
jgi:hypothetical protein